MEGQLELSQWEHRPHTSFLKLCGHTVLTLAAIQVKPAGLQRSPAVQALQKMVYGGQGKGQSKGQNKGKGPGGYRKR